MNGVFEPSRFFTVPDGAEVSALPNGSDVTRPLSRRVRDLR